MSDGKRLEEAAGYGESDQYVILKQELRNEINRMSCVSQAGAANIKKECGNLRCVD